MSPPNNDFVDAYLNIGSLSPDMDATFQSSRSTPSLLSGSSPDSQMASFDPSAASNVDQSLMAALMNTIATLTPQQQQQFLQAAASGSTLEQISPSASPPSDADIPFIQFGTAANTNDLPNWLEMSLLNSQTGLSPQSAPMNTTDPFLSMLLSPSTQSMTDPISNLLNASALPPPPPPTLPSSSASAPRNTSDVAAFLAQVYGDRQAVSTQNIPNLLEIVQSALSKQTNEEASTSSSSADARRKEARQRKHDEMEHDGSGSGSDSGIAPSKNTKRRKALSAEEKEEKQRERMLRNRAAAQESRDKKKRYVENLETMTEELKSQNSALQARLRHSESQNRLLESRLEALATHFIAHMASNKAANVSSALPLSPPSSASSSSHSPLLNNDTPQADSAAVDIATTISNTLFASSSLLCRLANPSSRPPTESPRNASEDPAVFAEPLDADSVGAGSTVSLSRRKQPQPQYAFGDADSFVIPSFADSRPLAVTRVRNALEKGGVVTSPQRTLWASSSWSTSSTPSAVSLASTAPLGSSISRKVVVVPNKEAVVIKEEEEVGVPSASPPPPSSVAAMTRSYRIGSDAASNSRELAVVSAAVVHSMLLWVVDVTTGGVAGRWRGRPGAGSGARWGYTGAPGATVSQPLLQKKRSWAGLRFGGATLSPATQERRTMWLDSTKA